MAREVRNFAVSVAAGTPQASPQTTDLTMPPRYVRGVRVRVPPGPAGVMGWALAASGVNVIPWATGQWMVMDDENIEWDLEGQIETGAWQLRAYNTGVYPHSVYVTFLVDPVGDTSAAVVGSQPFDLTA